MACVTAFTPAERPVPFRGRFPGLGPADDEPCPCGSSRQTRRCHWDRRTQRWLLPVYRPRRTKARTGVARDGCYANVSADCGENVPGHDRGKLSNEHWLSNAILKDASDGKFVLVSDLPFQRPGRIDRFPPKSMGASILCVDHNSSLSGLDTTAQSLVKHSNTSTPNRPAQMADTTMSLTCSTVTRSSDGSSKWYGARPRRTRRHRRFEETSVGSS